MQCFCKMRKILKFDFQQNLQKMTPKMWKNAKTAVRKKILKVQNQQQNPMFFEIAKIFEITFSAKVGVQKSPVSESLMFRIFICKKSPPRAPPRAPLWGSRRRPRRKNFDRVSFRHFSLFICVLFQNLRNRNSQQIGEHHGARYMPNLGF